MDSTSRPTSSRRARAGWMKFSGYVSSAAPIEGVMRHAKEICVLGEDQQRRTESCSCPWEALST